MRTKPTSPTGDWRSTLGALADQHRVWSSRATWDDVRAYAAGFRQRLVAEQVGDHAVTAGLAADQIELIRDGHWAHDVQEALNRSGAHVPNGAVHYFSAHELMGWSNLLAGTVFEQTVAGLANHGSISFPNGADHVVLAGRTQQGWDLALLKGREVVGHAQVKFSADAHTIVQHLQNHPDLNIVITDHDAAVAAARHGMHVIDAGVAYGHLHHHVASEVAHHLGPGHLVHEWVPEFAAIVILARAARMLQKGQPPQTVATFTKEELAKAGLANAAATAVTLSGHGLILRLPTAVYTRFFLNRFDVARSAADRATVAADHLRRVLIEGAQSV